MHIKNIFFSQAKLQVDQSNFHHNSNLDISTDAVASAVSSPAPTSNSTPAPTPAPVLTHPNAPPPAPHLLPGHLS